MEDLEESGDDVNEDYENSSEKLDSNARYEDDDDEDE